MDKYYGNVCELDIIFSFTKAYYILDEILLAGELQESSKKNILKCISQQDSLEDMEVCSFIFALSRRKQTYAFGPFFFTLHHTSMALSTPWWFFITNMALSFVFSLCSGRRRSYSNHVKRLTMFRLYMCRQKRYSP